jgi:two-component system, NarL family, nitrate/nitrite response regulator NarL
MTPSSQSLIGRALIRVLLIDDQSAVREGLSRLLACADFRSVYTASTPADALRIAAQRHPHVVVLDVDLAGEDGLALIPHFGAGTAVVVLTCHGDAATRSRADMLGARAFIEKHRPAAVLLEAITEAVDMHMQGELPPIAPGATYAAALGADSDAIPHREL